MEDLAHQDFVKTNHNRHLTRVKERGRRNKMIYEITNSEEIHSSKEDEMSKEMSYEESIEFIESKKSCNFTGRELNNVRNEEITDNKLCEVIELLKCGEKFEKIEQLINKGIIYPEINDNNKIVIILKTNQKTNKFYYKIFVNLRSCLRHLLCHTIDEIQYKYFPKEDQQ